jgi:hypothetical protein
MGDLNDKLRAKWAAKAEEQLKHRRIVSCRYMLPEELELLGWDNSPLVIQLDDGTLLYASSDDEGNNAGALFTTLDRLPTIPVI